MLQEKWIQIWKNKSFRRQFLLSSLILMGIAIFINSFFIVIQHRQAYVINDRILSLFKAYELSVYTFILIYSAIIMSLVILVAHPVRLLKSIQAYCILTVLRVLCIWLVPLETPPGIIVLNDPFVGYFFYSDAQVTKDLFFSGHVSTLFLLWLVNPIKKLQFLYLGIVVLVTVFILLQHVHYTVDVLVAPVFALLSYKLAMYLPLRLKH